MFINFKIHDIGKVSPAVNKTLINVLLLKALHFLKEVIRKLFMSLTVYASTDMSF